MNAQSHSYEKSLMAHGIPYAIYGGTRYYDRVEVKHVLAYIRLSTNIADDGAFRRIINVPPRAMGESSLNQIAELARKNDKPYLEAGATLAEGKIREKVNDFVKIIGALFRAASEMTLPEYVDYVIQHSGLLAHYSAKEEDADRLANIKEMVTAAHQFCEESTIENASEKRAIEIIDDFLSGASLESKSEVGQDSEGKLDAASKKAVTLMTVHAAKGLEFNTVILGGAEETVFPTQRAIDEDGEEEERRLMYVMITRAQEDLVVTYCDERRVYGDIKDLGPSRFLFEIPEELKSCHFFPRTRPAESRADSKSAKWKSQGSKGSSRTPSAQREGLSRA